MKKTYYCVISVVADQNMTLYKGALKARCKPEDTFWGNKDFSIGVDYFERKKERDMFFACNDMSNARDKKTLKDNAYHSVISVVSEQGMELFKGKMYARKKPDDFFKGDRHLFLDIEYFAHKKERDEFFKCNDMCAC